MTITAILSLKNCRHWYVFVRLLQSLFKFGSKIKNTHKWDKLTSHTILNSHRCATHHRKLDCRKSCRHIGFPSHGCAQKLFPNDCLQNWIYGFMRFLTRSSPTQEAKFTKHWAVAADSGQRKADVLRLVKWWSRKSLLNIDESKQLTAWALNRSDSC